MLLAEYQNAGRGRHGRQWSAPPRSQLALSVGVDASGVPADSWGWLPLATGVAVVDAVAEVTGVRVGLKWPNDVLVGPAGGKLAGILAEVASPGAGRRGRARPQRVEHRWTATRWRGALLRHLAVRFEGWRASDPKLAADYRARSVTIGSGVRAILPGDNELVGTAVDVDAVGRLIIDTGTERVTVSAGDITHLRPDAP
ncbi:biotin-[acetyl-CoA-carboxylase] ligase [Mycolicibacterium conceptionense]|uniref:biotin--[biotin carboxyl-carrier protein] ligase n=1 Tax=Mycolicibacterium conceptionense TaxID=451644 RepID=A0A0U1CZA0_9MYCO|nr:biotin-[acetyl-CoA-carboxylase] ligase [Mycolicibacterium conceptionense]